MTQDTDESGNSCTKPKKIWKRWHEKIQSAAGKGASAEEIGKIKDLTQQKEKRTVQEDPSTNGTKSRTRPMVDGKIRFIQSGKISGQHHEMLKNVREEQGIEGWVAAKIMKKHPTI